MASWQKRLRLAIALFVAVFAIALVVSFIRGRRAAAPLVATLPTLDTTVVSRGGPGHVDTRTEGKGGISLKFGNQVTYADGRSKLGGGVTLEMPDKNGRSILIQAQEAEITRPPGKDIGTAVLTGSVKLTTSDGITVTSSSATYNDDEQIVRIPGDVAFQKGRMTGSGVGATFDRARNVLWLLDRAKVDVAPDKAGGGEIHVTAKSAGMARNEHYMKFQGDARLEGKGQIVTGDDVTSYLTEDDERMTRMELRGNAHIAAKPGASGPQDMRANDIDLVYAEDGRTLQAARLQENASMQLPGAAGKSGRRIAAKTIDVGLAPDGATVTHLAATGSVQVDLPADGETPARRIRSASLLATGGAEGIQVATFAGDVEYRESRPAGGKTAAVERTARSARMDLGTKPGFGDLERASFHTNVHFTDGTKTTADAPTAVYTMGEDRLDLSPGQGDTGRGPHVSDGRISVEARTISMNLSTQALKADTNVRSVMVGSKGGAKADGAVRMPSLLKQEQPVNVKSNRLDYDGANAKAVYDGNARLWQDDTTIRADRITVEDKTGNLHATGNVVTSMVLTDAGDKPAAAKPASPPEPTTTTAEDLLYEDARHRATYTGKVHMNGPTGDVTAAKIELFLAEQGGQLERAEADGSVVSRQELRRAYGQHLSYEPKDGTYTMTGSPVKVYDDTPGDCRMTEGAIATFQRVGGASSVQGSEAFPHKSGAAVCGSGPGTGPAAENRRPE